MDPELITWLECEELKEMEDDNVLLALDNKLEQIERGVVEALENQEAYT